MADHRSSLDIFTMVFNRLPFLYDNGTNRTLISNYALEIMSELETCFGVDNVTPAPVPSNIGDESKYKLSQLVVVADLVAVYLLLKFMALNSGGVGTLGGSSPTPAVTKFLKKTKAGSVEVEWDAVNFKDSVGMYTNGDALVKLYRSSAIRKALNLGCVIDITEEGGLSVSCLTAFKEVKGFIVVNED